MHIRLLAAAIAAVFAVLTFPAGAAADHSWGPYHWARTSNPFTLKLGDNLSSNWDSYLDTSSSDWSKSSVLDTVVVTGKSKGRNCKATTGRVEVCNRAYGNNGWLGVAGISITGGEHITKAYVKLNDTYFDTPTYDTPAWRNLVMCQEVGHAFGLDHQDEDFDNPNLGTCMDYTSDPESNQHPNTHDYDQLETIYAHTDSFSTIDSAVSGSGAGVGDNPASWGMLISGSRAEGASTYIRNFGNGNLFITHVIWAR